MTVPSRAPVKQGAGRGWRSDVRGDGAQRASGATSTVQPGRVRPRSGPRRVVAQVLLLLGSEGVDRHPHRAELELRQLLILLRRQGVDLLLERLAVLRQRAE